MNDREKWREEGQGYPCFQHDMMMMMMMISSTDFLILLTWPCILVAILEGVSSLGISNFLNIDICGVSLIN